MEMIHWGHAHLGTVAGAIRLLLESVSVLCVAMGLIATLAMLLGVFWRSGRFTLSPHAVRLRFGTWLGMALEFQLGADIVATTVNPTLQSLTELAILAAVRTFLNYFLQKELEAGERLAAERSEGVAAAGSPRSENP